MFTRDKNILCSAVLKNADLLETKMRAVCDTVDSIGLPCKNDYQELSGRSNFLYNGFASTVDWVTGKDHFLENAVFRIKVADNCVNTNDSKKLDNFRALNYAGAIIQNHDEYSQYFLGGCAAISLYYFSKALYNRSSVEKGIIDELELKYTSAAEFLKEKSRLAEGNAEKLREVNQLARDILLNQSKSLDEMHSLRLPKLQSMAAKTGLIAPVLEVAKRIINGNGVENSTKN